MKKLFILAAAIVAFASCSKEPETVINDGSIYFTNALTTRATTVTNATSLQGGFNVLGYADDLEIFSNAPATYASEKSAWTVSPVKYWANSTNYNFFASYPASNKFTQIAGSAEKTSAQIVDFVNNGSVDLVLAGRNVETADNEGRTDAAQLVFKHALSRVRFSFTNAYSNTTDDVATTITVTDVALVAENKKGTVTITTTNNEETATSSSSVITWTNVATNSGNIDFAFDATTKVGDYENGNGKNIAETKHNTTDFKYIIPAMATETEGIAYQLACKIVAYDENGNVIKEFDYTQPDANGNYIPLKVRKDATGAYADNKVKHEAGKSYTYNMNITSSLNDITFTVAVEDWEEENGGEIDFPGDN